MTRISSRQFRVVDVSVSERLRAQHSSAASLQTLTMVVW